MNDSQNSPLIKRCAVAISNLILSWIILFVLSGGAFEINWHIYLFVTFIISALLNAVVFGAMYFHPKYSWKVDHVPIINYQENRTEDRDNLIKQLITVSQAVIDGDVRLWIGCEQIAHCLYELNNHNDNDFNAIFAFNSEILFMPPAHTWGLWDDQWLNAKKKELVLLEEQYRDGVHSACKQIILKYNETDVVGYPAAASDATKTSNFYTSN